MTTTAVLQRPRTTRQNEKKNKTPTLLKHLHRIRSLSFCSPPEPFDENAVDTDSFPPHPKSPSPSSSPFPVNHTFSSPTSSHGSFNTTTVPSGESSPRHLSCPSPAHFLFYSLLYTSAIHSQFPLIIHHVALFTPLLPDLSNSDLSHLFACLFLSIRDEREHVSGTSKPCVPNRAVRCRTKASLFIMRAEIFWL